MCQARSCEYLGCIFWPQNSDLQSASPPGLPGDTGLLGVLRNLEDLAAFDLEAAWSVHSREIFCRLLLRQNKGTFCAQKGQIQLSLLFAHNSPPTDLASWQLRPVALNGRTFSIWPSFIKEKRLQPTRTGLCWGFSSQVGDKTKKRKSIVLWVILLPAASLVLVAGGPAQGPPHRLLHPLPQEIQSLQP